MLLGSILLALAWAALQGEITLANLLVGYVFGYVILTLLAKGGVMPVDVDVENGARGRARRVLHLGAGGGERAGWPSTSCGRARRSGRRCWRIPLDVTSDGEILLLSMLINITPGSVTIDLSEDRRTLYVHVMHMTSAEASRREIKDGFERRVKLLFE